VIIPWNTDAPLYHPPFATAGLIAVNTLVHLLREQKRPGQALKVLARLPAAGLPTQLESFRRQLTEQAIRMRDQGTLELAAEDW
jgi:hypothetical protein